MNLFSKIDKFYKITTSDLGTPLVCHYTKGFNEYIFKEDENPDSYIDGMYFTNIKYIFAYLDYGSILLEATFPDNTHLGIVGDELEIDYSIPVICVDKCIILNAYYLAGNPGIIERLINNGADISVYHYNVYKWAYMNCARTWNMLISKYGIPDEVVEWIYNRNGYIRERKQR